MKTIMPAALMSVSLLLVGCFDQCGNFDYYEYQIDAAKIDAQSQSNSPIRTDRLEQESAAVSYKDFVVDVLLLENGEVLVPTPLVQFSLFNNAYACSSSIPYEGYLEQFEITSDADYSAEYPAGSNLNELFNVAFYYSRYSDSGDGYQGYEVNELLDAFVNPPERLQLTLKIAPSVSNEHTFSVKMNYENFVLSRVRLLE